MLCLLRGVFDEYVDFDKKKTLLIQDLTDLEVSRIDKCEFISLLTGDFTARLGGITVFGVYYTGMRWTGSAFTPFYSMYEQLLKNPDGTVSIGAITFMNKTSIKVKDTVIEFGDTEHYSYINDMPIKFSAHFSFADMKLAYIFEYKGVYIMRFVYNNSDPFYLSGISVAVRKDGLCIGVQALSGVLVYEHESYKGLIPQVNMVCGY